MKKILVVPSWYPVKTDRLPGLFFREQALLLKDKFDFRILYGKLKTVNILFYPFYLIFKKKNPLYLHVPPEGIGFYYINLQTPSILKICNPISRLVEKINYSMMITQFKKELKKLNWVPDLIHAHSTYEGGIVANALAKYLSLPFIITEHQVFLLCNFSALKRKMIKDALEAADKVLAVSEYQKQQILINHIICEPIVVGNYVDEKVFYPKLIKREDKSSFRILFVSYNSYIKDNETFFKALSFLLKIGINDFKVTVIGGDFNYPELLDGKNPLFVLAKKYGVSEYIEILNFIDRGLMAHFYNNCDVLVSTSIAETFGVAPVEAMMCGKPVIATANGGIDDYISEENGIKVPVQNFEIIGHQLIKLKNREIVFDKTEIRNSVINKYGITAFSERIEEIYNKV